MKTKFTIVILALCMMFAHMNPLNAQNEIIIGEGLYEYAMSVLPYNPVQKYSRAESVYPKTAFSSPCIIQTLGFNNFSTTPVQLNKLRGCFDL